MSLTHRAKNKLIAEVNEAFSKIGKSLPARSGNNGDPIAWEYFIASHLQSLSTARRENAISSAIKADVLPDTDKKENQREPGTDEFVFQGDIVTILLNVAKPRIIYDMSRLEGYLVSNKVKLEVVQAAFKAAEKTTKAGHKFTAIINTSDEVGGK